MTSVDDAAGVGAGAGSGVGSGGAGAGVGPAGAAGAAGVGADFADWGAAGAGSERVGLLRWWPWGRRGGVSVRSRFIVPGGVPGVVPRVAAVALALSAFAFMAPPYAVIAVALAVIGAFVPGSLGTWGCALMIGLAHLSHSADVADWRPYATLAVVHLLHVVGGLAMVVPWRARIQARALRAPLARWAAIQVPAQVVLVGVLFASTSLRKEHLFDAPTAAVFAVVAAVCLAVIAVLLVRSSPRR
jgi:hypothetical protein